MHKAYPQNSLDINTETERDIFQLYIICTGKVKKIKKRRDSLPTGIELPD